MTSEHVSNYRLLVHVGEDKGKSVLIPYSGQVVPKTELPEYIHTDLELTFGKRLVVEIGETCERAISTVEQFDDREWLMPKLDELNAYNRNIFLAAGRRTRSITAIPDGIFVDQTLWDFVVATIELGRYPLLTGATGTGKSEISKSIAAAKGWDFYPINCGTLLKPKSSLVGTVKADGGSTSLVESEFLRHFRSERPTIIFLDELSRIPSQAANYMMTMTDRSQSYVYVEELAQRIYKGKDVVFVAAANFGMQYVDTRKMDNALMNRFVPFHLDYLREKEEIELIMGRTKGAKHSEVKKLVECANLLRKNYDALGQEVSHRHMIDMAAYLTLGFGYGEIINNVLVNIFVNGNDDRRDQVEQILNGKLP